MVRSLRDLLVSVLIAFALLAAGEVALRVRAIVDGDALAAHLEAERLAGTRFRHPFLEYTAATNFRGMTRLSQDPTRKFYVRTNSEGFRTHEFYPKMPGRYRVVALGDSFTMGNDANQDETWPAVLESLLQQNVSPDVEVFSLGVGSYSGVRYAELARLYFDLLQPDLVIVAVDQSDFAEDVERIQSYELDEDGVPLVLKNWREYVSEEDAPDTVRYMDASRKLRLAEKKATFVDHLRAGSLLVDGILGWVDSRGAAAERDGLLRRRDDYLRDASTAPVKTYAELLAAAKDGDFGAAMPPVLRGDVIPLTLERAKQAYEPTVRCLRFVRDRAAAHGARVYFTSYPYPYMVSVKEAVPFQLKNFGAVYDLRADRVHPRLMDWIAGSLGVPHLDAYPVFEKDPDGKYGDLDQHFNAAGYAAYARFLYDAIHDQVAGDLAARRH